MNDNRWTIRSTEWQIVLIGDSVVRPIKPDLVFLGGQSQNLGVSGLAIDDINHWLANIPRNREVRHVVIHIGVNKCKFSVITESMWRQLIRKLKNVFPEAVVLLSSIVSPIGRLRKTVQVSKRSTPGSVQVGKGAGC